MFAEVLEPDNGKSVHPSSRVLGYAYWRVEGVGGVKLGPARNLKATALTPLRDCDCFSILASIRIDIIKAARFAYHRDRMAEDVSFKADSIYRASFMASCAQGCY